jgi:TP901 family phage tail tape measure protein
MVDFASLVAKMDSTDLKKGQAALGDVTKAAGGAEKAVDKTGRAFDATGADAAAAGVKVKGFATATSAVRGAAIAAAASLGAMGAAFVSFQAIAASLTQARAFNVALAETSTLIAGTPQEIEQLSAAARDLGKAYGTDATSQVQAFYQAISAGAGSIAEANTTLDAANRLAIGGATDVTTAVGILSGVINSYGKEAISATEVSDALFVGMKAGVTTVAELSANLGGVIPTAKALGISFDEVVAATSALTKNNLSTSAAVTSLNAALVGVVKPTKEASELAETLGINFTAAGLQAKGLGGFLAEVAEKTGGNVEQMAQLFGSVEALKAALLFAGEAGGQYAEIMEQMGIKAGATDAAYQKMSDSLDQRLNKLTAAAGDIALGFGNALLSVLVPAMEALASVAVTVGQNLDTVLMVIASLAATQIPAMITASYAAITGLTLMSGAMTIAAIAAGVLRTALAFLGGPIGLAVGAATALGIALISIKPNSEKIKLDAEATAKGYADAAGSAALFNQSTQSSAEASAEIKEFLDGILVASGGVTAEMAKQYEYAGLSRAESDASLKTANELLANLQQKNEIARLELAYGTDSVQVAEARQRAELAVLDAQLQSLDVSESLKLEILAAAKAGFDLAGVAGHINFDSATRSAANLSAQLGVSVGLARALAKAGAAKGDGGTVVFDPRDPRYDAGAAALAKTAQTMTDLAKESATAALQVGKVDVALGKVGGKSAPAAADGLSEAAKEAERLRKEMEAPLVSAIDGVSNAFGDFIAGGLKDFGGFVKSILDSFKQMLSQMISMALKNKILIPIATSMGLIGGATQAVAGAAAGGGGPLGMLGSLGSGGGMLGSIGGVLGTIGSNFGAGFMTSVYGGLGGLTGAVSGGLSVGGVAGISTAIGAIAAPLLAVAAVFSFFKKKTKELDSGLRVTVDGMDTLVQTFRTIETKRFWGLSKKVRTSFQNASDEIANPLIKAVGEIQGGIVDAAALLGIAGSTFDNFAHTINVSTKGLSDEAAQKAVTDAFVGMGDAFAGMIPELQALQKDGEGAMAAISRLAQSLTVVNDVFQSLGFSAYDVSLAGAAAADTFASLFGSLDNFAASTAAYYDAFYTGEEKRADATSRLAASLAALGVSAIPQDRAAFRDLVDSAQLAGNNNLAAGLIMLSPAFAGLTQAVDDLAELTQAVSQSYYQNFFTDAERIARATELLSIEMLALGIDTLPATRAAFRALVDEADALGDSGLVASLMQLSPAFAEIRAGADALGDSLRALVNEDRFATGVDFMRGTSRESNGIEYTPRESDAQLRAELRLLNLSMERLVSSSEITAGNTGRGADAADDTLAFTLEQTL